jgi:hypothetical protein
MKYLRYIFYFYTSGKSEYLTYFVWKFVSVFDIQRKPKLMCHNMRIPTRRYPYFDVAVAYATGRVSHARQVKGDDPDKKGYPGPPGWEFGVGPTNPHSKKLIVAKVEQRKKLDGFNHAGESW